MTDKPRVTEPIPRPTPYDARIAPWLMTAWRDAVHALDLPPFDETLRALGLAPDGKQALIAFMRSATTIRAVKTPGRPLRREVVALLSEHMGFHEPAHTEAIDRVLAQTRSHARLAELLVAEVCKVFKT